MKLIPWKKQRTTGLTRNSPDMSSSPVTLRRRMDDLFSRFFENPWDGLDMDLGLSTGWNPSIDVVDGPKDVTIRAEIPGVGPKDIEVSVSDGTLTIAGEKRSEHEERDRNYYRSERSFGSFRRSVRLPNGADPDKVTAEHGNGVLTVRVAKSNSAAPRRIAITQK